MSKIVLSILVLLIPSFIYADKGLVRTTSNDIATMKQEQRVALVIGNNEYSESFSKLKNPINDAKLIKDMLEDKGFEVIYAEDTTFSKLTKSYLEFIEPLANSIK